MRCRPKRRVYLNSHILERILVLHRSGLTDALIAVELGVSPSSVQKWSVLHGLPRRTRSESNRLRNRVTA